MDEIAKLWMAVAFLFLLVGGNYISDGFHKENAKAAAVPVCYIVLDSKMVEVPCP